MPRNQLLAAIASTPIVLTSLVLGACGSSAGPARASTAPSVTTSLSTATTTTSTPSGLAFLTAWGAGSDQWSANHTPDPATPASYWPRLPDGLDTYTNVQMVGGRVVAYVLNIYPNVSADDAKTRVANDLPLDTAVVTERRLPACDQLVESGPTVRAVSAGGLLVELESAGGTAYAASSVARIIVSPLAAGTAPPSAC